MSTLSTKHLLSAWINCQRVQGRRGLVQSKVSSPVASTEIDRLHLPADSVGAFCCLPADFCGSTVGGHCGEVDTVIDPVDDDVPLFTLAGRQNGLLVPARVQVGHTQAVCICPDDQVLVQVIVDLGGSSVVRTDRRMAPHEAKDRRCFGKEQLAKAAYLAAQEEWLCDRWRIGGKAEADRQTIHKAKQRSWICCSQWPTSKCEESMTRHL